MGMKLGSQTHYGSNSDSTEEQGHDEDIGT